VLSLDRGSFRETDVTAWNSFAVVVGSGTAALLGLLFVAVSIRVETIARSAELRNRSAQTLALLLIGLLVAVLLSVPDQRAWTLGAEYMAVALTATVIAIFLDRRAGGRSGSALARRLDTFNPTFVTCSLLAVAAVILVLGHENAVYLLVPALIAVLVGGVMNAWLILVSTTT
jgi:hypothetical protein